MSKPKRAANRSPRSIRSASSPNRRSGSPTARIVRASRSALPEYGSYTPTPSRYAIAFIVKSRRARSSSSESVYSTESGVAAVGVVALAAVRGQLDAGICAVGVRGGCVSDRRISDSRVNDSHISGSRTSNSHISGSRISDRHISGRRISSSRVSDSRVNDSHISGSRTSDRRVSDSHTSGSRDGDRANAGHAASARS